MGCRARLTFSRAFAEFAANDLPGRHEALIRPNAEGPLGGPRVEGLDRCAQRDGQAEADGVAAPPGAAGVKCWKTCDIGVLELDRCYDRRARQLCGSVAGT